MVTVAIIGILASTMLFALFGAQETARESKTRFLISKLNSVIMPKYESYRTRRVPLASSSRHCTRCFRQHKIGLECLARFDAYGAA